MQIHDLPPNRPCRRRTWAVRLMVPFFPSSAETASGDADSCVVSLLDSESCARDATAMCIEEWQSSAHHLSSFNNQWYRKVHRAHARTSLAQNRSAQWCAGCHDPALLFSAVRWISLSRRLSDSEAANAGLACVACHCDYEPSRAHAAMVAMIIDLPGTA